MGNAIQDLSDFGVIFIHNEGYSTGTGVSARSAIHYARGEISIGESITIESIIGSTFSVKVDEITSFGKYEAVIPEVRGTAFLTGKNSFWINPKDPLKDGFILR